MSKLIKGLSFIGLTIAMFMGTLDSTIVNIALPKIMSYFNTSLTNTSWVATIYILALAVFMITGSKIADRYGRKKVMLIGLALFGGFSAACMLANSLQELVIFRFFQGIGGAIITPIVLPMGIEIFGKENMSKVASIIGAVTALAAAGGPPIGGIILEYASWREVFGINVPLTIVSFLIVLFWIDESYDETLAGKVDYLGTILLTLGLGGVTFGMLEGREYGWSSGTILASLIVGLLAIIVFIFVETKVKNPLLELDLFREKTLTASCLVYFLTGFALVSPTLILNYFLQDVLNYKALHAALIIIPVSLTIMIAMPLGTRLFDRIGAIPVTLTGVLVMASSLLLLSFIKTDTPKEIMIIFLVINGIGFGFSSVSLVASVKYLPKNKSGIGSGIVNAARQFGTCLGIAVLVTVLDGNVTNAKNNIKHDSVQIVNKQTLSPKVKITLHYELNKLFSSSKATALTKNNQHYLKRKITNVAKSTKDVPVPQKNSDYGKIYLAEAKIYHATQELNVSSTAVVTKLNLIAAQNSTIAPLAAAMMQINNGNTTISKKQAKILTAIKLLAQKQVLKDTLTQIKHKKNQRISTAFSRTYVVGALIVLVVSPIALWTDKKAKEVLSK
ncbi:MFS transporter [Ligilactobacillus sp. WILCCON 0076]|uniref:MFS transporter n=1 Tax=Ligilactobacillus ubinensis TaxID=2876789 RepID=A0A9X2JN80_9LACO|nr:MFS transporter [Ligilactobacillus ubinensis]MCP0887386.1 MFS transporter [Ligilactobacillus ubinensis]